MKQIILIFVLIVLMIMTGCTYSPGKNDVVNHYGKITNLEVFQQFIENVKQGTEDSIRIVHYTDEGDPILHDVKYDGKEFISKIDYSRDKYSSGGKSSLTCKSLNIEEEENTKIYELTECDKPDRKSTLLVIRE